MLKFNGEEFDAADKAMSTRSSTIFQTKAGFSVGIVLTTRPFPYFRTIVPELVGLPVLFNGGLTSEDRKNIHLAEVGLADGELVTAGYHGWTMVVTGTGSSILEAQEGAYKLANRVIVPNLRFRNDIGSNLIAFDYARIDRMGLLDPA